MLNLYVPSTPLFCNIQGSYLEKTNGFAYETDKMKNDRGVQKAIETQKTCERIHI